VFSFKKLEGNYKALGTGLELKFYGKGNLAWITRGHMSYESKIFLPLQVFKNKNYTDKYELWEILSETLKNECMTNEYIITRLREAKYSYIKKRRANTQNIKQRDNLFRRAFTYKGLNISNREATFTFRNELNFYQ
jgi:hypothetical protein